MNPESRITKADKRGIELAVKYLRSGKAVVYPTDTVYGLAVDASNAKAVRKMMQIKERKKQPVHVIVSSLAMAKKYALFDKTAEKIFKKFLPGPLTLILKLRIKNRESWRALSGGTGTIGIRVPDNEVSLELVKKLKKPITTSSANPSAHLSRGTTPYSAKDSYEQFKNKKYRPDLYLDSGKLPKRKPSTMIRVKSGKIEMVREGPIKKSQIESV